MVAFTTYNREKLGREKLGQFHIVATATTGRLLRDKVGLEVEECSSTIMADVAEGDPPCAPSHISCYHE